MPGNLLPTSEARIVAELIKRQHGLSTGLVDSGGLSYAWEKDHWTVASTPATTYTLSFLPVQNSPDVTLNGLTLVEGTSYTVDYTTGVITVSFTLTAGDVLAVEYVTTGDLTAVGDGSGVGFSDNFNRADSTTTLGSPWSVWNRDGYAGVHTWGISANQAYPSQNDGAAQMVAYIDGGSADGTLQATIAVFDPTGSPGLAFRCDVATTNGEYYVAAYNGVIFSPAGAGGGYLGNVLNGGGSDYVAVGGSNNFANGDVMQVVLAGSTLDVYRNGTHVFHGTGISGTHTCHGMHAQRPSPDTTRIDDFSWTAA